MSDNSSPDLKTSAVPNILSGSFNRAKPTALGGDCGPPYLRGFYPTIVDVKSVFVPTEVVTDLPSIK